jgi:DNA polymerase III sliding clamp (beta) subunit (PCNA family)
MKIDREALLRQLEIVAPGISNKEIVEQSSCVVFREGFILSYNDEVACRIPTEIELDGAIHANTLLETLRKMKEEVIEIQIEESQVVLVGKNKKIGVRREAEIQLPVDSIEPPGKWKKLPEDFSDGLEMVISCAGKDENKFSITCVQLHPEWVQATDDLQIAQYRMELPIEKFVLIRAATIKQVIPFGVTKVSVTDNWVHFRSPIGLIISCRQHIENFPDTEGLFSRSGERVRLPKALGEAADLAEIFSSQNADKNEITITLKPGKLVVYGEGNSGWSRETKKIKYDGPVIQFRAVPKLLRTVAEKHNDCEICDGILKVSGGNYSYISALGVVDEKKGEE